jgi:CRISPR-associated protein Csd1
MILQSLYRYYEILLEDPDVNIAPPGYSATTVSFALNISEAGDLLDIISLFEPKQLGKKTVEVPRRMIVPEQVKRTGTSPQPNFLCDPAAFVLGISEKDSSDPEYSRKRFEAFRKYNVDLLSQANCKAARAVIAFLQKHNPRTAKEHPAINRHLEEILKGGNLIFRVEGQETLEDPEIHRVWEEHISGAEAVVMQCLVSGENEPIARLHPSIRGVRNANPTGASLVGFNERAYESYNRIKGQGLNSPVSQRIASGYGVALNYLLSSQNPHRRIILNDTSVVYWAESKNKGYANAFAALLDPEYVKEQTHSEGNDRKAAEEQLQNIAKKVEKVQALDIAALREGLDERTRFYVLGLAPNAARLAVRFFLTEPFGKFVERIMLHYEDLKIIKEFPDQSDYISIFRILNECVSPKVNRRDDELASSWSLLGGSLMRAILTGMPYPEELYCAMINRVRVDSDEGNSRKINYVRAAVIKAHLLRKYRRQGQNPYQEVLQMSLNESYSHPAYVLGRLFAVLEKVQKEAIGDVNASIKDRYFTSACATPASVFPVLLRLSQHHISKAEYGYASDNRIQELLNLLSADKNPFPSRLTLDEQGIFVLGYYHQRAAFFTKNNEKTETTLSTNQ